MASFAAYQAHGILPLAGGLEDQPATWVEAATYLDSVLADFREIERQESEARRKRERSHARTRR